MQRRESVMLECQVPGRPTDVREKLLGRRASTFGQSRRISDRRMAVLRKHADPPPLAVDHRIGDIDDAERRFASVYEGKRRAHAIRTHQARLDILPNAEVAEGLAGIAPHWN